LRAVVDGRVVDDGAELEALAQAGSNIGSSIMLRQEILLNGCELECIYQRVLQNGHSE
jgi:hypothetical protein